MMTRMTTMMTNLKFYLLMDNMMDGGCVYTLQNPFLLKSAKLSPDY